MTHTGEKIPFENQHHSDPEVRLQFIDMISRVKDHRYLSQLIDLMGDSEWRVRKSAVVAVSHLEKNEGLVKRLIDVLEMGGNVGQRNAAEEALIQLGKLALEPLLDRLPVVGSDVKKMIIEIVGELKDPRALIPMTRMTEDPDDNVKLAAIESLGRLKNPEALDTLFKMLEIDNILVQFVAVKALREIGHPRSVGPLLRLLEKKGLGRPVMEALGRFSDPRVQEPLLKGIESAENKVKEAAIGALYEHYNRLNEDGKSAFKTKVSETGKTFETSFLMNSLKHSKVNVRGGAMYVLAWMKHTPSVKGIAALLEGPLTEEAVGSLVELGPSSEKDLIEMLPKADEGVREGIVRVLGKFPGNQSKEALKSRLSDPSGHVRQRVADALGFFEDKSTTKDLLKLLSDPYRNVQGSAIEALGRVKPEETLEDVIRMLKSDNPQLRSNAVAVLGKIKTPIAMEKLILCLRDESPEVRKAAVVALGKSGDPKAEESLLQSMSDEDKAVRLAALLEVIKIPDIDLIRVFKPMLTDNDIWVRSAVARGLAGMKTQAAQSLLLELLKDKVGVVKIAAIEGLGKTGNLKLAGQIIEETKSSDPEVGRAALEALGALQARDSVSILKEFLQHPKWGMRNSAVKALGKIGAESLAGEIENLSKNDPERMVRKSAAEALALIKNNS